MHCKAHQKGTSEEIRGNKHADKVAREIAMQELSEDSLAMPMIPDLSPQQWEYQQADEELATALGMHKKEGKWTLEDGRILIPRWEVPSFVQAVHDSTHLGAHNMYEAIRRYFYAPNLSSHTRHVAKRCVTCARVNAKNCPLLPPGKLAVGTGPMEIIQMDFAQMPRCGFYKYMLVVVDTFTYWPEVKPTKSETAKEVVKYLLEYHIPTHGLPYQINTDSGPHFLSQVSQEVAANLGIQWKLHTVLHPQSSAFVERLNRTLKETLTKLVLETKMSWVQLLPQALFRIRNTPRGEAKLTPFEALFGRPSPLFGAIHIPKDGPRDVINWAKELNHMRNKLQHIIPLPIIDPTHGVQVGDWVYVKKWKGTPLQARWGGPYQVLLITPNAVKCHGLRSWIHVSRFKPAQPPQRWSVSKKDQLGLRMTFKKSEEQPSEA